MSQATVLAKIKTVLEAVAGVGTVHDYPRYSRSLGAWLQLMRDGATVNGWVLHREKTTTTYDNHPTVMHEHHFRIAGIYELDDAAASPTAKIFQDTVDAIVTAFLADPTLSGTCFGGCDPVQVESVDVLDVGETLYHAAELSLVCRQRETF
jgi:hypothetical protein